MLTAITEDGNKVYADEIKKNDSVKYYCPDCGGELIFRKGVKNIPHFSHKTSDTICHFRKGGGESIIHQQMKRVVKKVIERDNKVFNSELECKLGDRICDYYFEIKDRFGNMKKVAVECVHKHTDIETFRRKNEYYYSNNIHCLWVFNLSKFLEKDNSFKEEARVNEIIKESHYMNYGKIYCVDLINQEVYGVHLETVQRIIEDFYDEDGEHHEGYVKKCYSLRWVYPILLKKFEVNSFSKIFNCDWLHYSRCTAGMFTEKWW